MIQTPKNISPSSTSLSFLSKWQKIIDKESTYELQVLKAKNTWGKSNKTMDDVKSKLRQMSNNTSRCNYCEDSYSDEIEHIYPKDLYPEKTYVWDNYIYACGPCNGPKSNKFSLINSNNELIDITPPRIKPENYVYTRPPKLPAALINPRDEDPLHYLMLDIITTFYFVPTPNLTPFEEKKAKFTIEVLRLNEREYLVEARKQAYGNFISRIKEYKQAKIDSRSQNELDQMKSNLLRLNHITVWEEIKRSRNHIPEITNLFNSIPEVINW